MSVDPKREEESSGALVVDKPEHMSSAAVVGRVKNLAGARKVGHAGTLDPMATGVLVCLLGKATRLAAFLLKGDKHYEAVLRLGQATDTQDRTGTVTFSGEFQALTIHRIRSVFRRYEGTLLQQPPAYSALKHEGVPLYKLARAGKPVRKEPRTVHVSRMEILEFRLPDVRFAVTCSAGTYIRTLCADIGTDLGCGAHMRALHRKKSSGFSESEGLSMERMEELARNGRLADHVIAMENILRDVPRLVADPRQSERIRHGVPLRREEFKGAEGAPPGSVFQVVDDNRRLIAVVRSSSDGDRLDYRCVLSTGFHEPQ